MAPIIWKEPLPIRRQPITQLPEFAPKRLLLLALMVLLSGPLFAILIYLSTPHRQNWRFYWPLYEPFVLIVCNIHLVVVLLALIVTVLARFFEATYALNEQGLGIKKGLMRHAIPWRYVVRLEVVPHPTIEKVQLLRFVSRLVKINPKLESNTVFKWLFRSLVREHVDEFPFETGQIDIDEVFETYQKYARK